jgi:tRNA uridine 5-carbamoylmethylation protein Kti12
VITFKSTEDLAKLPPDNPAYPTVQELVERLITTYTEPGQPYNWRDYGYVILIEEPDVDRTLDEIWDGCTLLNIYWEGIMLRDGFFIAIYLANNEYGLVFVIPDAPWVNGKLRLMIEDNLDPLPVNQPTKETCI